MFSVTHKALCFYWVWLKTAFRHPIGWIGTADLWSSLTTAVLAIFLHLGALMGEIAWQIPIWIFLVVVIFRLLAAPYWIWREDQKNAVDARKREAALQARLDERARKQGLETLLGLAFDEGQSLKRTKVGSQILEWDERTYRLILAALGTAEAAIFRSGTEMVHFGGCPDSNFLEVRTRRLADLITHIEQVSINPDFDPVAWDRCG